MRWYTVLVFLAAGHILSTPSVLTSDERTEQEAIRTFRQYVSCLIAHYKTEKHERIEHSVRCQPPGYVKAAYEPDAEYNFDVRKTDSLVTPYIGILEFRWNERYSDCEETREKAQAQPDLSHTDSLKYRYTYGFQEGKWVPKAREIGGITAEGVQWESCEEERAYLESKGYEADFGCSVPY